MTARLHLAISLVRAGRTDCAGHARPFRNTARPDIRTEWGPRQHRWLCHTCTMCAGSSSRAGRHDGGSEPRRSVRFAHAYVATCRLPRCRSHHLWSHASARARTRQQDRHGHESWFRLPSAARPTAIGRHPGPGAGACSQGPPRPTRVSGLTPDSPGTRRIRPAAPAPASDLPAVRTTSEGTSPRRIPASPSCRCSLLLR